MLPRVRRGTIRAHAVGVRAPSDGRDVSATEPQEPHEPPPGLSYHELRNAAELLARQTVASRCADEATVDAHRPGAAGHEEDSAHTWLTYFGWLHAQMAPTRAGTASGVAARPIGQVMHEALADTPVGVTLRQGLQVSVYPKSLDTLIWLEALDQDLAAVRTQLASALTDVVADEPSVDGAQLRLVERLLTGLALRLFVWTLTTEGPGLPFTETDADPSPPEWTRRLQAEDIEALYRAHLQVNREDLDFLAAAFPSEAPPGSSRLPLSGFVGAMAHEWGLPARQVMRQWSMRMLYASGLAASQSAREAHAAAAADRGRG